MIIQYQPRSPRSGIEIVHPKCYYIGPMLTTRSLMRFLDRGFVIRGLLVVMLYSLVPVGEYFLVLLLGTRIDIYLIIVLVAGTSLLGLACCLGPIRRALYAVHESIEAGYYPEGSFKVLAGAFISAVLLVTPGVATDVLGAVLLLPFARRAAGRIVTRGMKLQLKELYEYLKLYEN